MFRILLYVLFAYLIWRIVQVIAHAIAPPSRMDGDAAKRQASPKQKPPTTTFTDVKDARFEDLPPSTPRNDKTTPSS